MGDEESQQTLIKYAQTIDAGPDVLRLLESYEMTLELVHATLAGDRERMLELLMDSESCDTQIMDISHQDEPDPDDEVGSIGQLRPRSLRETAEAMGHQHVLDLLPEEPANRRRRKTRSQLNRATAATADDTLSSTLPALRLNLSPLDVDETDAVCVPSRTEPRYASLRDRSRTERNSVVQRTTVGKMSSQQVIDVIATPRRVEDDSGGLNRTSTNGSAMPVENAIPTPTRRGVGKKSSLSRGNGATDPDRWMTPSDRPPVDAWHQQDGAAVSDAADASKSRGGAAAGKSKKSKSDKTRSRLCVVS